MQSNVQEVHVLGAESGGCRPHWEPPEQGWQDVKTFLIHYGATRELSWFSSA